LEELRKLDRVELGDVDVAVKTYYVMWCRFGGGGSSWKRSGFSFSKKTNNAKKYWRGLSELERIRERLSGVVIECDDFEKVIKRWDGEDVFMYIDPPYYIEKSKDYYSGFSREDHERLLSLLKNVKCKWLLSGYANELYDIELREYNRYEVDVVKYSFWKRGEKKPRGQEVLWCNYDIGLIGLFDRKSR
jgi:DNA adenine methylase